MTLASFRAEVLAFARMRGSQYIDDANVSALNSLISRSLREFTHDSLSMFNHSVSFSLTIGQASYDLEGSAFSLPIARVHSVLIDGSVVPGPTSISTLEAHHPSWRNTPNGRPTTWFLAPPKQIVLVPAPAAVYPAHVSAWTLHPTVSSDSDVVALSSLSMRTAVKWCAARLLEPYASPEEVVLVRDLMTEAKSEAKALAERNLTMITGGMNRGTKREVFSIG